MHRLVSAQVSRRVIWRVGRVERGERRVLQIVELLRLGEKDIGAASGGCESPSQFEPIAHPKLLVPRKSVWSDHHGFGPGERSIDTVARRCVDADGWQSEPAAKGLNCSIFGVAVSSFGRLWYSEGVKKIIQWTGGIIATQSIGIPSTREKRNCRGSHGMAKSCEAALSLI